MPCAGPSESEERSYEANRNYKLMGKSWCDHEWVENVACAYTAFVQNKIPLPQWAIIWSNEHERKDAARKQQEKNDKQAREDAELKKYLQLKKKFR